MAKAYNADAHSVVYTSDSDVSAKLHNGKPTGGLRNLIHTLRESKRVLVKVGQSAGYLPSAHGNLGKEETERRLDLYSLRADMGLPLFPENGETSPSLNTMFCGSPNSRRRYDLD